MQSVCLDLGASTLFGVAHTDLAEGLDRYGHQKQELNPGRQVDAHTLQSTLLYVYMYALLLGVLHSGFA